MLVPFCGKHEIKLDLPEYSIVQYHLSRFTNLGLLEIACIGRDNILQTLKFVLHVWPGICFDMDNIIFFSPHRRRPSCLHAQEAGDGSGLPGACTCTPRRRQQLGSLPAQRRQTAAACLPARPGGGSGLPASPPSRRRAGGLSAKSQRCPTYGVVKKRRGKRGISHPKYKRKKKEKKQNTPNGSIIK